MKGTLTTCSKSIQLGIARYSDLYVEEVLHVPGVGLKFNDNTSFLAE